MAGVFRPAATRVAAAPTRLAPLLGAAPRTAVAAQSLGPAASAGLANVRVAASFARNFAPLTVTATASTGATRSLQAALGLEGLGIQAWLETGIRTIWTPLDVPLQPGALWDGGASLWDGGTDTADNAGAVWDPVSRFGGPTAVPVAPWTIQGITTTTWSRPLR